MRRPIIIACLIAGIAILAAPQLSFANKVPRREYQRARILAAINEERKLFNEAHTGTGIGMWTGTGMGLDMLGLDDDLTTMAQAHAVDTANAYSYDTASGSTEIPTTHYIGHAGSNGSTLQSRITAYGIKNIRSAAELVAMRYNDPFAEENVDGAISSILAAFDAETPPGDVNKRHYLLPYTHVGVGMELYRSIEDDPENTVTDNALFLVIVFAEYVDDRSVIIPDPATVVETDPVVPQTIDVSPTSPNARFQYRIRIPESLPMRGKGRKRIIYRKPPPPGTGLGVIVEPESREAQEFYQQQLKETVQLRRLTPLDSSSSASRSVGEYAQMRRAMRMQKGN